MTYQAKRLSDSGSTVNLGVAITGPTVMYNLKEGLKNVGWTHWASGDGSSTFTTTPGNGSDVITGSGAGANGYDNNNAWWIGRDPSTNYQVLIQRGTATRSWRVFFTRSGVTFTGGSPSNTVPPTIPADALQSVGTSLAYATTFFPSTATWKAHCIADDAAINGVYGFWMFAHEAVFDVRTALLFEPIRANTHPPPNEEPFAVYAKSDGVNVLSQSSIQNAGWNCYYRQGANRVIETTALPARIRNASVILVGTLPVNAYDSTEDSVPIWLACEPPGVSKGFLAGVRWKGSSKNYPDTVDLAATAFVFAGDLLVPWPTGVTPT